jgi:AraC-like DNA-binding protein
VIAAWVMNAVARARLAAAVAERLPRRTHAPVMRWCDSAEQLLSAVAGDGATTAIIGIDDVTADATAEATADAADDASRVARVEEVTRRLRSEYPGVPVLIYAPLTAAASRAIIGLAAAGITNVIIAGHDDLNHAVRPILDEAASACIAEAAYVRLAGVATRDVASILGYALRYGAGGAGPPTVLAAARALRVHRKTLASWCVASGAPSPRVLVTWCRLIVAAERMTEAHWSTERVARAFGFGSGSTVAGLFKRHTGLTRAQLRARGSGVVVEMLARRLEEGRLQSESGG